jgi:hypothetical protein
MASVCQGLRIYLPADLTAELLLRKLTLPVRNDSRKQPYRDHSLLCKLNPEQ